MLHAMLRAAAGNKQRFIDIFGAPEFAYSLRLLSSTYAGECIRVRRSSDNAEQDIGFLVGVLDESALTAFVGANDGRVTTWYDQSGNVNNATETIASYQPLIVISGTVYKESGLPAVRYAGSSMDGMTTGVTGLSTKTVISVVNTNTGGGAAGRRILTAFDGTSAVGDQFLCDRYNNDIRLFDGGLAISKSAPSGRSIVILHRNSSEIGIRYNGSAATTGTTPNASTSTTLKLFEEGGSNVDESPLSLSESIVYSTDISGDAAAINLDVNDFYGVY